MLGRPRAAAAIDRQSFAVLKNCVFQLTSPLVLREALVCEDTERLPRHQDYRTARPPSRAFVVLGVRYTHRERQDQDDEPAQHVAPL